LGANPRNSICDAKCFWLPGGSLAIFAAWHLGHEKARARFAGVSKQPKRGKQPDVERNKEILEWYDREVKAAPDEVASIPRRMAEHNYKDRPGESVETFQKRIRRLVAARDEAGAEHERLYPRTLLTSGATVAKRERDI
jgi:hypothetical protein